LLKSNCLFNKAAPTLLFGDNVKEMYPIVLGYLNTKIVSGILRALNPTLNTNIADVCSLPFNWNIKEEFFKYCCETVKQLIHMSDVDWDFYETSWDFESHPILPKGNDSDDIAGSYGDYRNHCQQMTDQMQRLEEEINRIFIEAYGLQDELTSEVPLKEITLTCNPYYRYGGKKTDQELEALFLADTLKELLSYTIGCMMGRYSLDEPGLIYAHSGNIGFDLSKYKKFLADGDGIIPIMDVDWFRDDAVNRFVEFMKVAWPSETLDENLKFVAESLNPKRGEDPIDTIRRYLSTGFFKDHLKTYKKRPIYLLFSSGKQKAFECLVYLHRYNESTLSRMRSLYVTPLQGNIRSRIEFLQNEKDAASTASNQRKFQKEIDMLKKKQAELSKFDDELRHCADMRISLDLDDGVKVNYGKFGNLLAEVKAITGE